MDDRTFIEKLLDSPIALLVLSNVIFALTYFVWGAYKIVTIPQVPAALKDLILGGK
ncbi:MAG: hypothetical protein H7844_13230 [Nitrospirae bacterium YQR-1]